MDEDSDQITRLAEGDRSRTFSPSRRPSFQPWTRTNTVAAGSGFQSQRTPSNEPLLRRQRSRQFSQTSVDSHSILLDRPSSSRRNTTNTNNASPTEETEDSTEQWHSIALIFVALPAFAGMFFENGSAVMTDVLMLGLGCLFLYWSVKWPWQWYYSTQEMKLADLDPDAEFAVIEDSDDELDDHEPAPSKSKSTDELRENAKPDAANDEAADRSTQTSPTAGKKPSGTYPSRSQLKRSEAAKALQFLEIMALSSCFLSPAAVAYMLHSIRPYLSRPSGGVVSNSNLTLFVLAAELRPVLHFFRLVEERTLHLQRIVSSLPASDEKQLEDRVADVLKRLDELEAIKEATNTLQSSGVLVEKADAAAASSDVEKTLRSSLQPQLDALNRAVRRYEKRATTQAIVTEARLQDLEARLKDALSLAAAASRQSQRSGLFGQLSELIKFVLTKPLEAFKAGAMLPVRIAGEAWRFLFGPRRVKRRKGGKDSGSEGRKWASEFKGKSRIEPR